MSEENTPTPQRKWHDSAHASLCLFGLYLCQIDFFKPLEEQVKIQQKVLTYTPIQKLKMLFVGLLAGIQAVSHTATTIRVDKALMRAFVCLAVPSSPCSPIPLMPPPRLMWRRCMWP